MKKVYCPIKGELSLELYEEIEIYGKIFTGRDAVLPKIATLYQEGRLSEFGIDLAGSVIFHTAVSDAGIGPTSSNKFDIESTIPILSKAGVKLHLGKGALKKDTIDALKENQSYFAITPPTSALFSSKILSQRVVAFSDEGIEALHELEVARIPAIIAAANGKTVFGYL